MGAAEHCLSQMATELNTKQLTTPGIHFVRRGQETAVIVRKTAAIHSLPERKHSCFPGVHGRKNPLTEGCSHVV